MARQLDRLELAALAYLLLPLLVWLAGYLRLPLALPCALGCLWPAWHCLRARQRVALAITQGEWLGLAVIALAWVSLSGLLAPFHLNEDWVARMAVLRDLTMLDWPVRYADGLLLRCPLGYYLVPALIGKVSNMEGARGALWLYTVAGTWLFLLLLVSANRARARHAWVAIAGLAVFFSGMDVIGWLLWPGRTLGYAEHIEWWAGYFQYSSQTTILFWAPNHAIPGWLCALIVWRHREHGLAAMPAMLLMASVEAWAPLVAVGAAPLVLWCYCLGQGRKNLLVEAVQPAVLMVLPAALVMARYLTIDLPALPPAPSGMVLRIAAFSLFEWAILWLALRRMGMRGTLMVLAAVELLLLPCLRFGPGNDLVMRGGIPAITIILACTISAWRMPVRARGARVVVVVVLLLGSVTPVLEMERAFLAGPRYRDDARDFIAINGLAWNYLAHLHQADLLRMLKRGK